MYKMAFSYTNKQIKWKGKKGKYSIYTSNKNTSI